MKTRSQARKRVTIDTTRDIRFYRPGPITRRLSERAHDDDAHGVLCVALTPKERSERDELLAASKIQAVVRGRQRPHNRDGHVTAERRWPASRMATASTTHTTDLM